MCSQWLIRVVLLTPGGDRWEYSPVLSRKTLSCLPALGEWALMDRELVEGNVVWEGSKEEVTAGC